MTVSEIIKLFNDVLAEPASLGSSVEDRKTIEDRLDDLLGHDPKLPLFAEPYYWAAFTLWGREDAAQASVSSACG